MSYCYSIKGINSSMSLNAFSVLHDVSDGTSELKCNTEKDIIKVVALTIVAQV